MSLCSGLLLWFTLNEHTVSRSFHEDLYAQVVSSFHFYELQSLVQLLLVDPLYLSFGSPKWPPESR